MTIKAKDFDHIVHKFGLEIRNSGDLLAWFEYDGKIVTHTKRSHTKGKDLPFQHNIRQQLKLNEEEFSQAIGCTLSREDYIKILKEKKII
jgi:hypothetical protein